MSRPASRILLVDDDPHVIEPIRIALEERGYEVLVANDGAEGLMRIERDKPDLVVLDVVMPKRTGFAVLDQLQRMGRRSFKIVMLTANADDRHREFAESRGVDAFLRKPFDLDALIQRIETLLSPPADGDR